MIVADPAEKARAERVRTKLFGSMLAAYGYALLGSALWDPLAKGGLFTSRSLVAAAMGVAMHGLALYIAPKGEPK